MEWDLIHKIPLPRDAPKVNSEDRTIWDEKTMLAALQTIENPALHLAVHLSMILSLREGEIPGLQPSDLDFDAADGRGTILVNKIMQRANKDALEKLDPKQVYYTFPDRREGSKSSLILKKPKTKKSNRILYMTKPLKEELQAWLEKLKQDEQSAPEKYSNCGQLFRLPDGLPIAPELLTKWYRLWRAEHPEFEQIVFHGLRHSSATYQLLQSDGDFKSVQGNTGHATASVLMALAKQTSMQYNRYRYTDFMITLIRHSCQSSERQMLTMLKKDFWYDLPKELIAQEPASPRDAARLMVLSQKDDSIQHRIFHDLPEYLEPGDLLVVNNSKVLPARIVGIKQPTGAVCELLLLRQVKGDQWECLAKPGKRMQPGTKVSFGDGSLTAIVDETLEDGNKFVTFYYDTETLYEKLDEFGKMPLPPYITKQLDDQSQYQTVYAKELGSAAAPTAGLHFTPELMDTIRAKGVNITEVTLHVGLGTFRPVQEDEIADHKMHSEWYSVSEETAKLIHDTKAAGHRVIAVGTTSCRTLEAVAAKYGEIKACSGNTDIFLYPGVKFNCIDGLITNFHLPESTLIMLVSALYGYEKTMAAYKVAVEQKYRFFSFGDAMLIC